jgi:hypothetical protein
MKWLKFLLPFNPVSISISAAFSEKFSEVEMHWLKKYSFAFEQLQIPCSFAAWTMPQPGWFLLIPPSSTDGNLPPSHNWASALSLDVLMAACFTILLIKSLHLPSY